MYGVDNKISTTDYDLMQLKKKKTTTKLNTVDQYIWSMCFGLQINFHYESSYKDPTAS